MGSILPVNIATIKSNVPIDFTTNHNIPIKSDHIPINDSLDDHSAPKGGDIAANHFATIHYHYTIKRGRTVRSRTIGAIINYLPILLNSGQCNGSIHE
jgi:hypothetical protein